MGSWLLWIGGLGISLVILDWRQEQTASNAEPPCLAPKGCQTSPILHDLKRTSPIGRAPHWRGPTSVLSSLNQLELPSYRSSVLSQGMGRTCLIQFVPISGNIVLGSCHVASLRIATCSSGWSSPCLSGSAAWKLDSPVGAVLPASLGQGVVGVLRFHGYNQESRYVTAMSYLWTPHHC